VANDTISAQASPDLARQSTDVPSVRDNYPFVPGQLAVLAPREGYFAAIAVVPVDDRKLRVALFVKATTQGGVTWLPPRGTIVVDLPRAFSIEDGDAILSWLQKSANGKPGPVGPVVD
jgi:hypothetical protein